MNTFWASLCNPRKWQFNSSRIDSQISFTRQSWPDWNYAEHLNHSCFSPTFGLNCMRIVYVECYHWSSTCVWCPNWISCSSFLAYSSMTWRSFCNQDGHLAFLLRIWQDRKWHSGQGVHTGICQLGGGWAENDWEHLCSLSLGWSVWFETGMLVTNTRWKYQE